MSSTASLPSLPRAVDAVEGRFLLRVGREVAYGGSVKNRLPVRSKHRSFGLLEALVIDFADHGLEAFAIGSQPRDAASVAVLAEGEPAFPVERQAVGAAFAAIVHFAGKTARL